ncbi:MAG: phosphoribosylamine--glycine ligase [Tissierellia bacterium]|nr:phosphoribosylamine--glycine ligase [Tissierellia bacterium]
MNILIIGAGGREHAIASTLAKNEKVNNIFLSKHNGGSQGKIINAEINHDDFEVVENFIKENNVELTIVGPEAPLDNGIVDYLEKGNHKVFGPKKSSAILEGSKKFAKDFMKKYGINTAKYSHYDTYEQALASINDFGYPTVIKANGLCQGKGVYICEDEKQAKNALEEIFLDNIFKDQGGSVVIEQYLKGFEASLLCFVSGNKIYPFDTAMDYKKIYEGDLGPNTGGVGAISPNPLWKEVHQAQSNQILAKIEEGLKNENMSFSGILFIGYLIQNDEVFVLEFNTRFGDPETEVLLPRLKSDLLENIEQSINYEEVKLDFEDNVAMATILVSKGYPKSYQKGYEITGLDDLEDIIVYHNGTKKLNQKILSDGGRVLSIVSLSDSLDSSRKSVYDAIEKIHFENMSYRKDIGKLEN